MLKPIRWRSFCNRKVYILSNKSVIQKNMYGCEKMNGNMENGNPRQVNDYGSTKLEETIMCLGEKLGKQFWGY